MHRKLPCILTIVTACIAVNARAADNGALPPMTFDGGKGTFEVIERLRYEDRSENFDFDSHSHSPTDGNWWVQRLRVGASWKESPDLMFNFQLQDAREWGSERPKVPFILGAEGNEPLNLHVGSVTFGNPKTSPFTVTVGRQVLALGEERLVGPAEWNNFARVFDAVKGVWKIAPQITATAFVSEVVYVDPTTTSSNWKFEHGSSNDVFSGMNLTDKVSKRDTFETYLLWRDKKDNTPIYTAPTAAIPAPAKSAAAYDIGQDIWNLGVRYVRTPAPGDFDFEFEGDYQGGNVNRQTTAATGVYAGSAPALKQDAFALHSLFGFTPNGAPAKLRLDVEYNIASGDTDRHDNRNGSFMTLFPSGHKWYGFMDLISWKNMREFVATARANPLPQLALRADFHSFSLYTAQDAWYRKNGVATVRPLSPAAQNASTRVGDEVDLTGAWTISPWATVEAGWCWFRPGSYLAATGAHSHAEFTYVQTTLKF
jgi:hypothetical protein